MTNNPDPQLNESPMCSLCGLPLMTKRTPFVLLAPHCFLTCDDLSKQLLGSVSKERHAAHQELIKDDTHGPPIHRLPVALTENDLGSDVLRSPTHLRDRFRWKQIKTEEEKKPEERKRQGDGLQTPDKHFISVLLISRKLPFNPACLSYTAFIIGHFLEHSLKVTSRHIKQCCKR